MHRLAAASCILFLLMVSPVIAQEAVLDLYSSGAYESVIGRASDALQSGDTSINTLYLKAMSEVQLGRTEDAVQTLQTASTAFPEDQRFIRMLAGQYLEAGAYTEARKLYTGLVQSDSADISSLLRLAEISSFTQDYKQAVPILEWILVLDSANLKGLIMLGEILTRQNNPEAIEPYEKAFRIFPENQQVAYALGNWYIQEKMPDKAVVICEQILSLDTANIRFQKLLGYAYYKMEKPDRSIGHFRNAVLLGDSSAFTFKFMGIANYLTVDFNNAIVSLQEAVLVDSMDAEVHFFLGASLGTTTQKQLAIHHLEKSMKLMKPDPAVMSRIYSEQGNIMRLEMEYEKAYELYNLAWEADTTSPIALYYMASILDNSMHLSKEALVDYQRFLDQLDLVPEPEEVNNQLPTIRGIVEDRIELLKEELFFLDE